MLQSPATHDIMFYAESTDEIRLKKILAKSPKICKILSLCTLDRILKSGCLYLQLSIIICG